MRTVSYSQDTVLGLSYHIPVFDSSNRYRQFLFCHWRSLNRESQPPREDPVGSEMAVPQPLNGASEVAKRKKGFVATRPVAINQAVVIAEWGTEVSWAIAVNPPECCHQSSSGSQAESMSTENL